MPSPDPVPNLQSTRAAISVAVRRRDPRAEVEARRTHAAAVLEKHIREVVAAAPPLTANQRGRLSSLLRGARS